MAGVALVRTRRAATRNCELQFPFSQRNEKRLLYPMNSCLPAGDGCIVVDSPNCALVGLGSSRYQRGRDEFNVEMQLKDSRFMKRETESQTLRTAFSNLC